MEVVKVAKVLLVPRKREDITLGVIRRSHQRFVL
jgi:hypothetical protein